MADEEKKSAENKPAEANKSAVENIMDETESAIDLAAKVIRAYEGFEPEAYFATDIEEKKGEYTVGYGNRFLPDGSPVPKGMKVDQKKAEELMRGELKRIQKKIDKIVEVPLTARQEAVLLSLAYNSGVPFVKGTKFLKKLNTEGIEAARKELWDWNGQYDPKTGKFKKYRGLTERRVTEEALLTGQHPEDVNAARPKKYQHDGTVRQEIYKHIVFPKTKAQQEEEEKERLKQSASIGAPLKFAGLTNDGSNGNTSPAP